MSAPRRRPRSSRTQPAIVTIMAMVGVLGALGLNFAINISTMATVEFGKGAGEFVFLGERRPDGTDLRARQGGDTAP